MHPREGVQPHSDEPCRSTWSWRSNTASTLRAIQDLRANGLRHVAASPAEITPRVVEGIHERIDGLADDFSLDRASCRAGRAGGSRKITTAPAPEPARTMATATLAMTVVTTRDRRGQAQQTCSTE